MKDSLLVTMGCSFTVGVGVWDESITPSSIRQGTEEYSYYYELNLENFKKGGWPSRVAKKLGFKYLLNLGKGGDSISGQMKLFTETILHSNEYKDFDITIIFLLPEPSRFSIYSASKINSYTINSKEGEFWASLVKNPNQDFTLEKIFYLKLFIESCENRNFSYFIFDLDDKQNKKTTKDVLKNPRYSEIFLDKGVYNDEQIISKRCGHFNENGYELVSNNMVNEILKIQPNFTKKEENVKSIKISKINQYLKDLII